MLLFQKKFHQGLTDGSVTVTFRRWARPHVKPGGRYRCHPIGVLVVDAIERVRVADISERDARRSGFSSREELMEYIRSGPGGEVDDDTEIFRVDLHHGGEEDRVAIALDDHLSPDDVEAIRSKLARMDARGEWTGMTLRLIEKNPRVVASELARRLGRERLPFKEDVRKLKRLGLTQSFEIGYDLTPRGRAYLTAIAARRRRPARRA
jgi:hypothetical protein